MSDISKRNKRYIRRGGKSSLFYEGRKEQICRLLDEAADEFLQAKRVLDEAAKPLAVSLKSIKEVIAAFQEELGFEE